MIFVKCSQCRDAWFVQGEQGEVDRLLSLPEWKESFPCPTPLCGGRAVRAGGMQEAKEWAVTGTKTPIAVSLEVFYRAVMGLGTGAPTDLVRKLLLESKIVAIYAEPVGEPQRTIIQSLTFADGTKMHFGISQKGACIYNVEGAKGDVHTDADTEGGDSDREEVGRGAETAVGDVQEQCAPGGSFSGDSTIEQPRAGSVPNVSTTGGVPTGSIVTAGK